MPEQTTFGRRVQAASGPRSRLAPETLTPAAKAFRAQIASDRAGSLSDFERWQRSQQGRLALAWLLRIALLSPGALSLAFHASWQVAIGLELAGLAATWWLRKERRRHRAEIVAWSDEQLAER